MKPTKFCTIKVFCGVKIFVPSTPYSTYYNNYVYGCMCVHVHACTVHTYTYTHKHISGDPCRVTNGNSLANFMCSLCYIEHVCLYCVLPLCRATMCTYSITNMSLCLDDIFYCHCSCPIQYHNHRS